MVTIVAMVRLGRIALMFALAMVFAMHSPTACNAAQQSCHHSSDSAAPLPCCNTTACLSAVDSHHDACDASAFAGRIPHAPALVAYLAPRPPLNEVTLVSARTTSPPPSTPLIIELQTLLI